MAAPSGTPTHLAVDRALQIISYLGTRPDGATLQEISQAIGIPKPSVHRVLAAMRDRGFAVQPRSGGAYLLGPAALAAAFGFHAGLDLRRLLRPLMLELQDVAHQTVHLARLDGGDIVYIDKLDASIGVRLTSVIGGRNPATATGVGKALLAARLPDDAAVQRWVDQHGPLVRRTPRTVSTVAELAAALRETRRRGYAIDDEESESGLSCVAAVVPLVFGDLVPPVAISITGLTSTMTDFGIDRLGETLVRRIADFEFGAPGPEPTSQGER